MLPHMVYMGSESKKEMINSEGRLRHIAFIMDGNGRWAQKRGLPRKAGHVAGAKVFKKIVDYCSSINIQAVTVYAFSTENWNRPEDEIKALMKLIGEYITNEAKTIVERNVQLHFLGDKAPFGEKLKASMEELENISSGNKYILNIALNYGGRDEIVHAANLCIKDGITNITEDDISARLYTKSCPPLDMIVRTGAETRISNFLLWQAAYAELYFTDVLWPDYTDSDVDKAVIEFYSRKRRFGKI